MGGAKIARIDAYAFMDGVVASPTDYGFTNVTGAFMTLNLGTGKVTYAAPKQQMAKDWFFWDDLHPTTRGHKYFAESALVSLYSAFPDLRDGHGDNPR
jgi:phospholipase/lecithinase/hemolysin